MFEKLFVRIVLPMSILCLVLTGCKKDSKIVTPPGTQNPTPSPLPLVSTLKTDSVTQNSYILYYQLSNTPVTTGIRWDSDSTKLLDNTYGARSIAVLSNNYYKFSFTNLMLSNSGKYYFKVFATDKDGNTTYSKIYSQAMPSYSVISPFIVVGPASLNNSLIVNAFNQDTKVENYTAKLNGGSVTIYKINAITNYSYVSILIDVPAEAALGNNKLELYYMGKLVYSKDLTVVNGGLLTVTNHPGTFSGGSFFTYQNQLYTFLNDQNTGIGSKMSFWRWAPSSNNWQQLPNPNYSPFVFSFPGYEINGVIYFPPYMKYAWGVDASNSSYDEIISTYTPSTGIWKDIPLFHTNIRAEGKGISINNCFVYKSKLYCILQENTGGMDASTGTLIDVVKVFNPSDGTWQKIMQLPTAWGYRAIVSNNKIYVLATLSGSQVYATTDFVNEFYLLDMENQTLFKKNFFTESTYTGVYKPYMFTYNNKIYIYGGQSSSGYVSNYSPWFACYDPNTDSWSPIAANTYNSAKVSQTDGFALPINGTVYVGLGYDNYNNGTIGTGIKNTIYSLSIK